MKSGRGKMLTLDFPQYGYQIHFTTDREDLPDEGKELADNATLSAGMTQYRPYESTIYLPMDWWTDPERTNKDFPYLCDVLSHEASHAVSRMWEHASCFPKDADDMEHHCCHVGYIVDRILRHLGYS